MNFIIILTLILSFIIITFNLTKLQYINSKPKIEYRYMPKKILDQQFEDNMPSKLFSSMFNQTSPWINTIMDYDRRKQEAVNTYFISQI